MKKTKKQHIFAAIGFLLSLSLVWTEKPATIYNDNFENYIFRSSAGLERTNFNLAWQQRFGG